MVLFLGVARALKAMHGYKVKGAPGGPRAQKKARAVRQEAAEADEDAERMVAAKFSKGKRRRRRDGQAVDEDDDEEEDGGQGNFEQEPLMDGEVTMSQEGISEGELRAYAHRDVKPGNIMIDDSGNAPILMDLGSMAPSPIAIVSPSSLPLCLPFSLPLHPCSNHPWGRRS